MTVHCLIHHRPLVVEHTSRKLICIPCYLAKCRAQRNGTGTASATNERYAIANRERSRKYMARKRAAAKGRQR